MQGTGVSQQSEGSEAMPSVNQASCLANRARWYSRGTPSATWMMSSGNAAKIDVSLDVRFNVGQGHAARGGDVSHTRSDARGNRVEEEFNWCGRRALSDEDRRMIRVEFDVAGVPMARNWNLASSGCPLTTLIVAKSFDVRLHSTGRAPASLPQRFVPLT